jgi:hypothetical protein
MRRDRHAAAKIREKKSQIAIHLGLDDGRARGVAHHADDAPSPKNAIACTTPRNAGKNLSAELKPKPSACSEHWVVRFFGRRFLASAPCAPDSLAQARSALGPRLAPRRLFSNQFLDARNSAFINS